MYLGCAACSGLGCGDCRIHGDDGGYQLGIVPLLLFAAPAIARAVRRGRARRQANMAPAPGPRPAGPPPGAPPTTPGPRPGLLQTVRQVIESQPRDVDELEDPDEDLGGPMNYPPPNALGAARWPFRPRRCVARPAPGGGTAVVDADTNEMVGYLPGPGDQGMGADYFGGGYDQFGGAEAIGLDDDDDDLEDEIAADELGAEVDDAIGAAEQFGDDSYLGAADDKLQNKIARLDRQIDDLRDKSQNVRNPFAAVKRKKIAKKIAAKQRAKSKLQSKLRRLQGTQRKVDQVARGLGTAAGAAGAGAAAAMLARQGLGGPPVFNTRAALNEPSARIADPRLLAALRRNQTADGLRFSANSPPGSGRQIGIQFYADVDVGNPRNAITVPVAGISAATTLRTRNLPYATCTIVGFQTRLYGTDNTNNAIGLVRDLLIEGGTNLFLASGWIEASQFDDPQAPQGLRSYPQLQTTNNGQVDVAASGDTDDVVVLTCSLIVDIVSDDTYGLGVPGVYAG
jgi:hypothetical protein